MTERADYIRGLCELASLLTNNDEIELPFEGRQTAVTIYPHNETALAQAVACIHHMEPNPTVEIKPAPNVIWLTICGHIRGLRIEISLRADHVCQRQVGSVYRTQDGEFHEVIDYSIPDAILNAIEGR